MNGGIFIHRKTGNKYVVVGECLNYTNAQDGQEMVIYFRDGRTFVREKTEFLEKFAQEEPFAPERLDEEWAMTDEQKRRERKIPELDKTIRNPYWGIVIAIPKAMVRRAQALLGLPEMEATWLVARRYTDVDLPESIDGMADDLYVSRNLDFESQTVLLSITSTVERKGMFAVAPGCHYPHRKIW